LLRGLFLWQAGNAKAGGMNFVAEEDQSARKKLQEGKDFEAER